MLRNLIKQSGERQTVWAERLGVSEAYLSLLLSGAKTPSLALAVSIERETGGAVPASSWIPEPAPGTAA